MNNQIDETENTNNIKQMKMKNHTKPASWKIKKELKNHTEI